MTTNIPTTTLPSRYVSVTDRCGVCGAPNPAGRPRRTCSDACRQAAWRRRRQPEPAPTVPAGRSRLDGTIYTCPSCEQRYLATQWCQDCQQPCRRLSRGGTCPECDELITIEELLQ